VRISDEQRRNRLGRRHMLAASARTADVDEIASRLVGLHATDSATVVMSAWARSSARAGVTDELDRALYERCSLRRMMHCMRRTLFVVPEFLAPALQSSTTNTVATRERASVLKLLAATGPERDAAWLARAEEDALAALRWL
jgi:hypothetical protein